MMIRTALVACAGLVLAACQTTDTGTASSTAAAPPPAKPAPAAEKSAELDPDQRICKTESVSGSQIPKRVCMTRAQWDAKREAGRDATGEVQRNSLRGRDPNQG